MATTLAVKPSHPALLVTGLATPPLTPTSPLTPSPVPPSHPVHSYAQLRAHHASALKYVIAKLRWEQVNNGYLIGEDAWLNHNMVIGLLEKELSDCQAAQKGLDRFPNCYASTAFPKPHGPLAKAEVEAKEAKDAEELKIINAKLDAQFPWLPQLFIGPRTKQQARNDKLLRELLREGDFEDLSVLLPSENMRYLMEGGPKKGQGHGHGHAHKGDKKSYEQVRYEREKAKVAEALAAVNGGEPKKVTPPPRIGPMTKEEWMGTLPVYGPKTLQEYLLPTQREQRHVILSWLRKPWPVFDPDAAELMEKMGRLALKKLEADAKEAKIKASEGKDGKGDKDGKEGKGGKDGNEAKDAKGVKEDKKIQEVKADKEMRAVKA